MTVPILLISCKIDIRNKEMERKHAKLRRFQHLIDHGMGETIAKSIGAISYVETSSTEFIGVDDLTETIVKCLKLSNTPQILNKFHSKKLCELQ